MRRVWVGVLLFAALAARPAGAQQSLSDRLTGLFRFGDCGEPLCLTVDRETHGDHYIGSAVAANAAMLSFLSNAINVSVASIPISATSSGFTVAFVGGAPVASRTSAGPIFAERGPTLGRGRILVGANTTGMSFTRLRGISTDTLEANFVHQDIDPGGLGSPNFEHDVINVRFGMELNLLVTSFFATYGVLDNVDVSVAVPLVRSSLDARSVGTILGVNTAVSNLHLFNTAQLSSSGSAHGSYTGLGDLATRVKVNVRNTQPLAVALLADVRLPTGDEDNFAGAGSLSGRALAIVSSQRGNFSPHVNAGYALRTGDAQNDALLATVGFDHLVAPWATVAADLITEWQVGESNLRLPGEIALAAPEGSVRTTNIPRRKDNLAGASIGTRLVWRDFGFVVNGLMPLRDAGLQARVVWTLGVERSF